MEAKHTPGPWLVEDKSSNDVYRYVLAECDDIHPVARITLDGIRHDDVAEANARLIAAAPELLEAAIELKDVCNRPSSARTRAEAWRKLDKAIAKALQPNA